MDVLFSVEEQKVDQFFFNENMIDLVEYLAIGGYLHSFLYILIIIGCNWDLPTRLLLLAELTFAFVLLFVSKGFSPFMV